MPKWTSAGTVKAAQNQSIKVLTSGTTTLTSEHLTEVQNLVTKAVEILDVCDRVTANYDKLPKQVNEVARNFFVLDDDLTQDQLLEIRAVLTLTRNGLANPNGLNLKFGNFPPRSTGSTAGYVNVHSGKKAAVQSVVKRNWTRISRPTGTVYKGDIHINANKLGDFGAEATLIHAATHKFADTKDFDERGYTYSNSPKQFRDEGLTTEEAFQNAESYDQFFVHVWLNTEL